MPTRLALLVALLLSATAFAEPPAPGELPPSLRGWSDWVLAGQEARRCPFLQGDVSARHCAWPAELELSLDDDGGRFTQTFKAFVRDWAALPGDMRRWPQDVKVDGKGAVVTEREGVPMVLLEPGEHRVSGTFAWDALPESLQVPSATGLLAVSVRGKAMAQPTRDANGAVFLQRESSEAEAENLEVRVHRKISDEVPLQVTTHVQLDVSGKGRELVLGKALLEGFVPMSLEGTLPARVEADGRIRVQARAGKWDLWLLARREGPATKLTRPDPGGPWTAEDEIWVFEARPALRQVLIEGVPAVDPQQTTLPPAWRSLPAYAVKAGETMTLSERRRGDADPPPDELTLSRELWLDFDGGGLTASDRISGALHRSWRLEMGPGTQLGHVVAGGADQVLTSLDRSEKTGVELRQGQLLLLGESRIEGSPYRIPAVSWDADFNQASATLKLPPGWSLFHVTGADDVPETWLKGWSLLDLFLLMIITFATGKLWGKAWGAIAFVTLGLVFPESDGPKWVWLFVLAGEALVRLVPVGWIRRLAVLLRIAAWAALAIIVVPFARDQVRVALYPAMDAPDHRMGEFQTRERYLRQNAAAARGQRRGDGLVALEPLRPR